MCIEFSVNILETIFTESLRIIEGWQFVAGESKDYLSVNLEGEWIRRYGKIASILKKPWFKGYNWFCKL